MEPRSAQDAIAGRSWAIRNMFSAIAPRYDLLNHLLSFGIDRAWRRALVARISTTASRVLDLACGTGDVALRVADTRSEAGIFGADFALPMLQRAAVKIARRGRAERIVLLSASAERLPYRDRVFDAVTIAFGIRNVVRRERGLAEMFRVLRPAGQVLILDFSTPPNPIVRSVYGFYFHRVLPLVGGVVSGNLGAYRYLPRSVEEFPPRPEFVRALEDQGFREVGYEDLTFGVTTLYWGVRP